MKRTISTLALTLALIQLCSSAGATSDEAIRENNNGVTVLKDDPNKAIQHFIKAIQLEPDYDLAKENLAIALNNAGIAAQANPAAAKLLFQRAMYLTPNNPTVAQNLAKVLAALGLPTKTFDDRVKNGNKFLASKDELGAIVEYQEALKLKDDPSLRKKLEKLASNANLPGLEGIKPWRSAR